MLHHSPREFGKQTSLWTLADAAEMSFEEDLTERRVSGETIRATLARLEVRWERAKRWIESPDPEYERKRAPQRLIRLAESNSEWVLGYEDETWWSRVEQPSLHSWAENAVPMYLLQKEAKKDDPDPKGSLLLRALSAWAGTT
jgi:hypothetical protein